MLDVPLWLWIATVVAFVGILALDLLTGHRNQRAVTTRAAALGV
ncbi:MAG: hypothetical protein QOD45_306, partial [Pseudonocardiales bacterium]|nr:hypothetical protein [Pseudonocardiales bacterium]